MRNPIAVLRIVGWAEGVSFLVLLFIAMPLKYMAGMPLAVRIVGSIHGGLFTLYAIAVWWAARSRRWSWKFVLEAIVAALYPAGTFLLDRKLQAEERAYTEKESATPELVGERSPDGGS